MALLDIQIESAMLSQAGSDRQRHAYPNTAVGISGAIQQRHQLVFTKLEARAPHQVMTSCTSSGGAQQDRQDERQR